MKQEDVRIGMEVYVEKLRPKWNLHCDKRKAGLAGFVLEPYEFWADGAWTIKHKDGSIGRYYYDEIEPEYMIYWYKVRKMYGYE